MAQGTSQKKSTAKKRTNTNGTATKQNQLNESHNSPEIDWKSVARTLLLSRALDQIEEKELVPAGLITYQFSSRGHDLAQIILGEQITHPHDAATLYYRSRPFVLTQGLEATEALCSTMGRAGGISEGRDIGVVHNLPRRDRATVLPTSGDVGAQFTPAIGWAQAIEYRSNVLGDGEWKGAIAVALSGDAACATNGFWSALTIATTLKLPYLFFVEDNGYGISVTGDLQTPGGSISVNLASFTGLKILSGSGVDPEETSRLIVEAVQFARSGSGPVLLHLRVPRLSGHSYTDNQSYKSEEQVAQEEANDPLPKLRDFMVGKKIVTEEEWVKMEEAGEEIARKAAESAKNAKEPDTEGVLNGRFYQRGLPQVAGGLMAEVGEEGYEHSRGGEFEPKPEGPRMNMVDAIRRALESELQQNNRVLLFGEDVGMKGGVHGATIDLQHKFGQERVFDTSLNEEGIIGRAVGMAMAGLMPVPEIQFRKYADPAHEQITDCGTIRWRTAGKFAAPLVVRIPVGYGKKTGDPWHSVSGEALYAHLVGWQIAIPSNAEDAVGLLRSALRGNDPTMFFEHRALLDTRDGRRPWPGDNFILPFGKANVVREGTDITIVTWGEMVHRAAAAAEKSQKSVEVIDLRTVSPWDKETVLNSIQKTNRCIVLHEDNWTCGFGGEIAATIAQEAFHYLDAPVERMATPDIPIPYNPTLMAAVVPGIEDILERIEQLIKF
ncbi:MAG: pyruvate dehydrogenase [Ignavibacteriae bacterium]|nr:pyruvate dehydrogenase [Ignavibacteriota bacterium]MCB9215736.1 pyruvate dehydrogenase [Ignavibacteria bacterium]